MLLTYWTLFYYINFIKTNMTVYQVQVRVGMFWKNKVSKNLPKWLINTLFFTPGVFFVQKSLFYVVNYVLKIED